MGAWGTAIFSDDLAVGIREEWRDYIGDGLTPEEATRQILADYADAAADQDEAGVVWLALAVSQWRTGRLVPEVLARAIEIIDSGSDLRRWQSEDARQHRARARVLAKTPLCWQRRDGPGPGRAEPCPGRTAHRFVPTSGTQLRALASGG